MAGYPPRIESAGCRDSDEMLSTENWGRHTVNDSPDTSVASMPPEVGAVFANLAEFVYGTSDLGQVYAAICVAATQIVPGCDHASVMERSDYATVAGTSRIARHADAIERETGEGACLDSIENEPMQLEADLQNPRKWGRLAARLLAETPIRGALGFRLLVDQRKTGALDLFTETANAFDTVAVERGIVLASFATVAASTTATAENAGSLNENVQENREVDKAVRMLMVLHGGSEQQAYDTLHRISHDINIKLEDVAAIGTLQGGFNAMATGLTQRDRVRDLFGRHVGGEVAAAAEREHPNLGGEERHVAVVLVDLTDSTQLVTSRSAPEIVEILNRFFSVVVEEVDRHHGLVNKFEGDASLAVFGAPNCLGHPEDAAFAAARGIVDRLGREVPECQAGVGVAAGTVVAGNVGSDTRFEYTVIGVPVHEAARLCELAKNEPARLLSSMQTVDAASELERSRWQSANTVTLRGYNQPIRLATPV